MKQSLLLMFYFFAISMVAQTKVSGEVKDAFGEPVAFANVIFKDSFEGTITNEEGRFYLESDETYTTVSFSFIGYNTLDIELTENTTYKMEIIMEEEAASLDEVIVYSGKQSKKNNPAIDILRKIWENRRENGVKNN